MINQPTYDFIHSHRNDDVRQLALRGSKDLEVDMPMALQQIAGRQRIKHKLPELYAHPTWLLPPTLNIEQSSSELTARYKAELIQSLLGTDYTLADLTGGLGVDFYYCSRKAKRAFYIDHNTDLCSLARHNMPDALVFEGDATEFLQTTEPLDVIVIDPARRDIAGRKVAALRDCTPDLTILLPIIRLKSRLQIIKLSPMLDWHLALQQLQALVPDFQAEVHVLAVGNECKELLLVAGEGIQEGIHCCDLKLNQQFSFSIEEEQTTNVSFANTIRGYLYEPNVAILKAGAYKAISRLGVTPIAPNTHLYVSDTLISDFPGRIFRIEEVAQFDKKTQKEAKALRQASISTRNFPLSPDELRKKLALKDGGDTIIWAFTDKNNNKILLFSKKM